MTEKRVFTLWDDEGLNEDDTFVLRKKSKELTVPFTKKEREEINALIDSFINRDDAAGLSAPQIGISKRIIIFRNKEREEGGKTKAGDYEVLINPRITQARGEKVSMAEGCLSCPEIQVEVNRFPEIKVRAFNTQGEKISKRYLDFIARVVQHEIDHLDGKLIVDYDGNLYYPAEKQILFEKIFKS
ncbi:MAG TPA: peptide deformylase [Deltaproteobacteria bacterium]|nr:peptide deformylase [Deltaproteobacteria bacterium]